MMPRVSMVLHLEKETTDSVLVRWPTSETAPVFLPISQIEIGPERQGRLLMVTMPRWLAETKGLISKPDPNQGRLF